MMAYLTRPGFNGGGSVSNRTVLPKRKPAAEVKKRKKINYEKIKQYLGKESQELIERELGFAQGGAINPRLLKQRFIELVSSIQDAEPEEIPGIVAQAKEIKDKIDELNQTLSPERQIKITAQGIDFDNPLLDAAKIEEAVMPTPEVTGGLTKDIVPESLTTKNPALKGAPVFPKGIKGTLADPEEKEDPKPGLQVGVTPRGKFVQASMKAGRRTDKTLSDYLKNLNLFRNVDLTATEGSFAEGGSVETPKRGLVDEPGSYGGERAIPRKYIDGITVSETLDGKKTYYAKVKVIIDETKSFSDSNLEKVKKWKEKNSAIARKKGFKKRDMSFAAEQTKKQRAKEAKKTAKARANIDKWTKNWLNKNLNKYDVRELDLY